MLVEDLLLIKQKVTCVTIDYDDNDLNRLLYEMDQQKIPNEQFLRVWIHTHPGSSATPSGTDESTFNSIYRKYPHAIMFILAQGGQTYTRLRLAHKQGLETELQISNEVVFNCEYDCPNFDAWKKEYEQYVSVKTFVKGGVNKRFQQNGNGSWYDPSGGITHYPSEQQLATEEMDQNAIAAHECPLPPPESTGTKEDWLEAWKTYKEDCGNDPDFQATSAWGIFDDFAHEFDLSFWDEGLFLAWADPANHQQEK